SKQTAQPSGFYYGREQPLRPDRNVEQQPQCPRRQRRRRGQLLRREGLPGALSAARAHLASTCTWARTSHVTGDTASGTFPTTPGAYGRTWAGPGSVFVTKVNAAGSALVYSTFVGVAGTTGLGYSIAVDSAGNAYLS